MTSQVEGTNDSSCLSKGSAAKMGYFSDEFLSYFINKCPRRAPLIHLGYSVRAVIINFLIDEFVNSNNNLKQIVSFGAGFDTLFFKLKKKNPDINVDYYELDLPRVVKRKMLCIHQSDLLCQIIAEYSVNGDGLCSKHYKLLAADLRDIKAVENVLKRYGLAANVPTLFLSECAITYLNEDRSSDLIKLASEFEHATFITYEQIHPDDGFGLVMLQHFSSLQSPLMSVMQYPTLAHQTQRYINHNWDHCTSISALDAFNMILSEERRRELLLLEPFDEWEEFYLKCVHYAIVIASKGSLSNWTILSKKFELKNEITIKRELAWELVEAENVFRYGHNVVLYNDQLLVIGGFGIRKDGTHGRMKDLMWLKWGGSNVRVVQETKAPNYATMYSSWTAISDVSYIVYGGRTSPIHYTFECPEMATIQSNSKITCVPVIKCCDRAPRWRHSAIIAKRDNMDTFVVFGGRTSELKLLNDTWMVTLHPDLNDRRVEIVAIQEAMPCARFSHSAAVRQKKSGFDEMWVTGGLGHSGPLGDVWCLDMESQLWHELPVTGSMMSLFSHTSSVIGDSLVMVGGVSHLDNCQPGVSVIDLQTGHCLNYQLPGVSPGKSVLLINHCHIISSDKKTLWTIGGGGNCFSFGTFFNSHCAVIRLEHLSR